MMHTMMHTGSIREARRALLSVLTIVFAAACGNGTGPDSQVPPPQYDLVFDGADALGTRHLYRMSADGGAPTRIGGGIEGMRPSPSPDGTRIAFHTPETYAERSRLRVIDRPGETAEWLVATDASEREVTWSPDGRRVAFVSKQDDRIGGDIFVADVEGRRLVNMRNLTPRVDASPEIEPQYTPAWSPDGTRIAFTSYRSGGPAIWVMNADGTGARPLTDHGDHIDAFPTWSPDNRSIAFQRNSPIGTRVGIVSVEDRSLRFLPFASDAAAPAWSPNGEHIAILSAPDGDRDVFVVTTQGRIVSQVRREGADYNPAWSRRASSRPQVVPHRDDRLSFRRPGSDDLDGRPTAHYSPQEER
jgi:TolB protein